MLLKKEKKDNSIMKVASLEHYFRVHACLSGLILKGLKTTILFYA